MTLCSPYREALCAATISAALLGSRVANAADRDPWFGPDKALHFGVSVGLAAGGYGVSALFLEQPWQRATAGAGFSLTLGAGKELYDLSGHGDPSWRDFTWDVVGTAVGIGVALLIDRALLTPSPHGLAHGSQIAIAF